LQGLKPNFLPDLIGTTGSRALIQTQFMGSAQPIFKRDTEVQKKATAIETEKEITLRLCCGI
jgi:hypothetical protein